MHSKKNTIFIDWGTSNVRAFLLGPKGEILDQRKSEKGIKFVPKGQYPSVYHNLTDGWRDDSRFTLMAGMVGSANGWEEAPYVSLPASPERVGHHIYKMKSMDDIYIVGGLCYQDKRIPPEEDVFDVIRGEEVQILGLISKLPQKRYLFCLPGTHSKWLEVDENAVISSFTTVMSGDFYAAIRAKTIIAMSLETAQEKSQRAFDRGVRLAQNPGGLMAHIFKIRGSILFQQIEACHVESMLSGVIIGNEIYEMKSLYNRDTEIQVIASNELGENYGRAMELVDLKYRLYKGSELSLAGMRLLVDKV